MNNKGEVTIVFAFMTFIFGAIVGSIAEKEYSLKPNVVCYEEVEYEQAHCSESKRKKNRR